MKEVTVTFASDMPNDITLVTTFWTLITTDMKKTDGADLGNSVMDHYAWLVDEVLDWLPFIIEQMEEDGVGDVAHLKQLAERLGVKPDDA